MFFINPRNKKIMIKDKVFNDSDKIDVDYKKQILTFWKPVLN